MSKWNIFNHVMMSMQMYLELILAKWSIKPMKTWNKSMKILSCRNLKEISKALSFYTLARYRQVTWTDAILFFPMRMPLSPNSTYSIWISRYFLWKMQKYLTFCRRQNSNPGPFACEPDMLPQDQWGGYVFAVKNSSYQCMWREIQSEYVQLETRGILMVKFKMASVQDTCPSL